MLDFLMCGYYLFAVFSGLNVLDELIDFLIIDGGLVEKDCQYNDDNDNAYAEKYFQDAYLCFSWHLSSSLRRLYHYPVPGIALE
jgi:hypothetical protein